MSYTFNQLKQAIQDFTENTETTFVNNLAVFIKNAEERVLKNVQLNLFMRNLQGVTTAANQYLGCPTDFLAPYSITLTNNSKKEFLEFKDMSFVEAFHPDASVQGTPRYYAQFDVANFILAPTPDQNYVVDIQYLYRPQSLTAVADPAVDTTWLSRNADLAMLYGSLVEAYTFMKGEPDIMANYDKRFQEAVMGLKMLGEAKEVTQEYRVGKVIRDKQ